MKNYFILALLPLVFAACIKDDDMNGNEAFSQDKCLTETTISVSNDVCNPPAVGQDIDYVHVGSKSLSETSKADFVDFCFALGSDIGFSDANGNSTTANIRRKEFNTLAYEVTRYQSSGITEYCLESEEAFTELSSEEFTLRINLVAGFNAGIDTATVRENITTGYFIWAFNENARQVIFDIDVEDYLDEAIESDTSYVRYHDEIILNGTNYTELYSNENNYGNGLGRKEKVYFHPKDGLIAVRDSLGVLWTRD